MSDIRIRSLPSCGVTVIPNQFLDDVMPRANGEFVKVYLYLMRLRAEDPSLTVSASAIADKLGFTEQDVLRALRYWEAEHLLSLEETAPDGPAAKAPAGKTRSISPQRMEELSGSEDIRELLFVAQQYLGKMLTATEMQKLLYYYDGLHFSTDLIEYLIEYCVSHGHTSIHYIDKVAMNWFDSGIRTVKEARHSVTQYNRDYYEIMNMLGISGRNPVDAEIALMKKWLEDFSMPMELIREAANRTIMQTSGPNFRYMDSILTSWHEKGVRVPADIAVLDEAHEDSKKKKPRRQPERAGHWNDLPQRDYDFDELEAMLIGK